MFASGPLTTEALLVEPNTYGCFLCHPSVELWLAYARDGSWRFCEGHVREIANTNVKMDERGHIYEVS